MIASQNGHAEVVDTLLQHGASVDLQSNVSAKLYFVNNYTSCAIIYISRC